MTAGQSTTMAEPTEKGQRRIAWFPWIWRTSVLLALILLAGSGVTTYQNGQAIKKLQALELEYDLEPGFLLGSLPASWQSWLYYTLGYECVRPFESVSYIRCLFDNVDNIDLALLNKFRDLRELDLYSFSSDVSDNDLIHLKNLIKLERLDLTQNQVSDAGLVHLKGLINLKNLDLTDTQVSGVGLIHLSRLTKLERLALSGSQVKTMPD